MLNRSRTDTLCNGEFLDRTLEPGYDRQRPVRWSQRVRAEITIDLLNGCEHHCPGCYIHRKNLTSHDDLKSIKQFTSVLREAGFAADELFLGPTDIFSAENFDTVIDDPIFHELTRIYSFGTSSTLMSDSERTYRRFDKMKEVFDINGKRDLLFLIVIDVEKFMGGDITYLSKFNKHLRMLENDTVTFLVNFSSREDFAKWGGALNVAAEVKKAYNAKLRLVPSFLNATNPKIIHRDLPAFNQLLIEELTPHLRDAKFDEYFPVNMLDEYFNGMASINYTYKNGELYIAPYMFEGIPIQNPLLAIPRDAAGNYTLEAISATELQLQTSQFEAAKDMAECSSCEYLPSCVSRNVLSLMSMKGLTRCPVPKQLFHTQQFDNIWDS